MKPKKIIAALLLFVAYFLILTGCRQQNGKTLFTKLAPAESGIDFVNVVNDKDSSYSFINEFGYMGGGVGVGDFNNDGLKDIFFTGNQVSSRLYLNKGNNHFEDISAKAGITTNVWCTGVSIADVNNDGYDDIYVCVFGKDLVRHERNLLFINQHNLTFTEQAAAYGLADTGNSTQAAFFDYDHDGDLDMYLANYFLSENNANSIFPRDKTGRSPANDKLFRNDGLVNGSNHPVFTDVTAAAGILEDGYGLGLAVSDLNDDGWPDVYVANDFISNDELWLNNRNGTFTNVIASSMQHQSYSSMGTDAADLNNDGLPDVVTLDMLPETNERKKTSVSFMNYERYESERSMGYEPEFVRNMLQLNNGVYHNKDTTIPFFSEIGQYAGINATDWSWSVLMADFDNDCWKDIHITNGIGRDFINGDFLSFSGGVFNSMMTKEKKREAIRKKLAELNNVNLPNYLFKNNHDNTFGDVSAAAGIDEPSMSNGAAYADLDNDGDIDLLVNNINKEAFVFINNTYNKKDTAQGPHFLKIHLLGDSLNTRSTGAKLLLYAGGIVQMQEQYPVRGYFSSVDQDIIFGMGAFTKADSLLVIWPGGKKKIVRNITADQAIVLHTTDGKEPAALTQYTAPALFKNVTGEYAVHYKHTDVPFNDYTEQRLLPQKFSQQGPTISVGDVNGDGLNDFFIGGSFNFPGKFFISKGGQSFSAGQTIGDSIKLQEETGSLLIDFDNDKDLDLVLVYGDSRYPDLSPNYKPALYVNDGKGSFLKAPGAFSDTITTIAGCVTAGDYDGDGDPDLFIGGRVSKKYPLPSRSYILRNDNGRFTDVTATVCPMLFKAGMVTAAVWADIDNDKKADLVIAGEWMPVRFFHNNGAVLQETNTALNESNYGMWRSLTIADADNDGDMDVIAGNLGTNCDYRCSEKTPLELFAADLDKNGSVDPVPFYYIKNNEGNRQSYPAISLSMFGSQVPMVFKKYLFYADYAKAGYQSIFGSIPDKDIVKLHCNETRSCVFENTGNGTFVKHVLPGEVQFAPVNAILCSDFDGDGKNDLLLAGNEYQAEVITGRYDASYGCFLKGGIHNQFLAVPVTASGFFIKGDVRNLSLLPLPGNKELVIAGVNDAALQLFQKTKK